MVGERLRELREESGFTQAQVVGRLQRLKPQAWDISTIIYSTIELGKRSLSDIEVDAILRVLGKNWSDL